MPPAMMPASVGAGAEAAAPPKHPLPEADALPDELDHLEGAVVAAQALGVGDAALASYDLDVAAPFTHRAMAHRAAAEAPHVLRTAVRADAAQSLVTHVRRSPPGNHLEQPSLSARASPGVPTGIGTVRRGLAGPLDQLSVYRGRYSIKFGDE